LNEIDNALSKNGNVLLGSNFLLQNYLALGSQFYFVFVEDGWYPETAIVQK